ncbi:hypothetical protein [Streptomyces sp. NPDC055692]|uniref:hypothetical protein n=1 Tax=Streptomyces sp. NPDC055692 TaxID=3155683 RepID=UPI00341B5CA2
MLRAAVNNDVEIVRNAHTCLVFTDPLPPQGLTWRQMIVWWTKNHENGADEKTAASGLYRRLYRSLDSVPVHRIVALTGDRQRRSDGQVPAHEPYDG